VVPFRNVATAMTFEINPIAGSRAANDRQKRDMRCTDAAHVTILLIFGKCGSNHKRLTLCAD
jgi:hypothetical protein